MSPSRYRYPPPEDPATGDIRTQPASLSSQALTLVLLIFVVCSLVAVVHWPVLSAQALSFDDQQFLTENPLVRNPSWASTGRFLSEILTPSTVQGYYLPVSMISLMLDYGMGGRPGDLHVFHRTSLALHVLNTALIIVLLHSLFGQPVVAALVGLLFGVHPLTVEPIAWVGERKTLLATFFSLGCLLGYIRYVRHGGRTWFALALVAQLLALLSKPTAAPLPILLVLLDYWPLRRLRWRTVLEKWPFVVLSVALGIITLISHGRTASLIAPSEASLAKTPLVICHLIVFYFGKLFWPTRLTSVYPLPEPVSLANPTILLGLIGTGILVGLLLISLRRTRAFAAGGAFFLIAVLPTLGLVQYSWVTASDKYVYLPMLGLLIVAARLLTYSWNSGAKAQALYRAGSVVLVLALSAGEAYGTRAYLPRWADTFTHARYMAALAPQSAAAHLHLGYAFVWQGNLEQAVEHFRTALQIQPFYPEAEYNLAMALRLQGKLDEAISHFQQFLQGAPLHSDANYALGLAFQAQNRLEEATSQFQLALRINPHFMLAHYGLGQIFQAQGRLDEAAGEFRLVLDRLPYPTDAHADLGCVLQAQGRFDEAIRNFRRAIQINPRNADAHSNLGGVLASQGKFDEAISHFQAALSIDPDSAETHYNWGLALQYQGDFAEAIKHYRRALEITPDYAEAHNGLGVTLSMSHQPGEALDHFREAVRLRPDSLAPLNAAAWIMATAADVALRNEAEAVRLAERAAELTGFSNASVLDTVAAAYASAGKFDQAVATAEKAYQIAAGARPDQSLAAEIKQRLELYRQSKPYREPAAGP